MSQHCGETVRKDHIMVHAALQIVKERSIIYEMPVIRLYTVHRESQIMCF